MTQSRNLARLYQLAGYYEQARATTLQMGPLQMLWSTEPLEPIQQRLGQQDNLEECLVRLEILRRNLSQGVGILQLSDDQLRPRVLVVKRPKVERQQREVVSKAW